MLAILLKYRIRMLFSIFRGRARIGRTLAVILASLALIFGIVLSCLGIYIAVKADPVVGMRLLEILIAASFHGIFVLLLFTGLSLAIFTIFFGGDLELLFSLPLDSRTIFMYKFIESIALNARFAFLFLAPVLMLAGIVFDAVIWYYFTAVIITVLLAAIPGSLGIIFSAIIARHISRARMKNTMAVAGAFLGIGIWIAINAALNAFDDGGARDFPLNFQAVGLISSPLFAYLPSGWAYNAAVASVHGNWLSTITPFSLLAVSSLVLSYLAMAVTARHYRNGIVGESQEASLVRSSRSSVGRSPFLACMRRDLILLYRQPQVLVQIAPTLILLFLFPLIAGNNLPGSLGDMAVSSPTALFALVFGSQLSSRQIPLERLGFCWNLMISGGIRLALLAKITLGLAFVLICSVLVGSAHILVGAAPGVAYIIHLSSFALIGYGIGLPIGLIFADFNWDHPKRMLRGGGGFLLIASTLLSGFVFYLATFLLEKFIPATVTLPAFAAIVLTVAMIITSLKMENFEWVM